MGQACWGWRRGRIPQSWATEREDAAAVRRWGVGRGVYCESGGGAAAWGQLKGRRKAATGVGSGGSGRGAGTRAGRISGGDGQEQRRGGESAGAGKGVGQGGRARGRALEEEGLIPAQGRVPPRPWDTGPAELVSLASGWRTRRRRAAADGIIFPNLLLGKRAF